MFFFGVYWASSGGCAFRALCRHRIGSRIILFFVLLNFFQGAVFGAGHNVVPGNVNVSTPVHVARMPCSSWPRKELRWSTSTTLGHCIRRLWTADPACGIDCRRHVCHVGTARRLMCATASTRTNFKQGLDAPFHCLFPNRYRLDGDVPECANAT